LLGAIQSQFVNLPIWRSLPGVQGCHTAAEKRAVAAGEAQSPDAIASSIRR
jgi:hypothetical protein